MTFVTRGEKMEIVLTVRQLARSRLVESFPAPSIPFNIHAPSL
jgi:hypothetical protein